MPIVNGQYQAPTWVNGQRPPINATELQAMCDTIEKNQTVSNIVFQNFFTGNALYHGSANVLSANSFQNAGASVGNYALIAGGRTSSSTYFNTINVYDDSLTRTTPITLSVAKCGLSGASVGNYALFAGGLSGAGNVTSSYQSGVDAYDDALSKTTPTSLSVARYGMASASIENYAIFAGGDSYESSTTTKESTVDAYNDSLTRTNPSSLSTPTEYFAGTSIEGYALFGGGRGGTTLNSVIVYNNSLTKTTGDSLSVARYSLGAASNNNYALFAGGLDSNAAVYYGYNIVDAYDSTLTHTVPSPLSVACQKPTGGTSPDYCLFAGGYATSAISNVCSYDTSLTLQSLQILSAARYDFASATVGGYMLFAGGQIPGGQSSNVDTYTIETSYVVTIPGYSQYYFEGLTDEPVTILNETTLSGNGKLNGYVSRGCVFSGYYPQS